MPNNLLVGNILVTSDCLGNISILTHHRFHFQHNFNEKKRSKPLFPDSVMPNSNRSQNHPQITKTS